MSAPVVEPSACTWCAIARRGHGRQFADAVGWHEWAQPSQEQVLARMKARRLAVTVAREGALPMPVPIGPEPQASERGRLRAALIEALGNAARTHPCPALGDQIWSGCVHYDEAGRVSGVGSCHSERRADAVLAVRDVEVERLTARIAELERTVQQMCDGLNGHDCPPPDETPMGLVTRFAVRLMEAERLLAEDGCSCPPVDRTHQIGCPLDGVPAPGPDAVTTVFAERAVRETDPGRRAAWRMLAQDVTDGEHYRSVHHDWRLGRDLPEMGGA